MSCAIGLAFEVAVLVGVNFFEQDKLPLSKYIEQTRDKIALLPKRIQLKEKVVMMAFNRNYKAAFVWS